MENTTSLEDPVYFKLRRNIEFCEVRILCFRPDVTNDLKMKTYDDR